VPRKVMARGCIVTQTKGSASRHFKSRASCRVRNDPVLPAGSARLFSLANGQNDLLRGE
jgi:hypothetical protein